MEVCALYHTVQFLRMGSTHTYKKFCLDCLGKSRLRPPTHTVRSGRGVCEKREREREREDSRACALTTNPH